MSEEYKAPQVPAINKVVIESERGDWTSASNAQADALCPGRHLMQRGIPDEPSDWSSMGTRIHSALSGQPVSLTVQEEDIKLSCEKIEAAVIASYFGLGQKIQGVREKRFWLKWPDGHHHSGQVDRFYRSGAKGLIVEFKSLAGEVPESPKNMQLRDQVILVDANVPLLQELAVVVVQPLVTHSPELCVYSREDIVKARDQLYYRVVASNKPSQKREPGEIQCKYCKARKNCPEYQQWSTQLVKVDRSLLDIAISKWTPDQRRQFCDGYDAAKKWLDYVWDQMEEAVRQDQSAIPGYQLVDGSPRSKIKNLQAVFDRFSKHGGSLEKFMQRATITKKDLGEITREATKLKGQKLDEAIDAIIADDVEVSPVKKSLKKVK